LHVFEVLLTLFNLSLTMVFESNISTAIMVYYVSGIFCLVNLAVQGAVGPIHSLTFAFNCTPKNN
jgi:hypothetical protein